MSCYIRAGSRTKGSRYRHRGHRKKERKKERTTLKSRQGVSLYLYIPNDRSAIS